MDYHLEVALALAVFHRRLAEGVVGARRAALGDPGRAATSVMISSSVRAGDSTAPVQVMSPTVR